MKLESALNCIKLLKLENPCFAFYLLYIFINNKNHLEVITHLTCIYWDVNTKSQP